MTLSVRFDAETERLLAQLSRRRRSSKSAVLREAVRALAEKEGELGTTRRPYDAIAHLIGCVKGGPSDLSLRTGERFRELLIKKRRERR